MTQRENKLLTRIGCSYCQCPIDGVNSHAPTDMYILSPIIIPVSDRWRKLSGVGYLHTFTHVISVTGGPR